jgi:hypothetical protein
MYYCEWRQGKVVANNTDFISGDKLFESNFCHPPTTSHWNEAAPRCLNITDEYSCSDSQCVCPLLKNSSTSLEVSAVQNTSVLMLLNTLNAANSRTNLAAMDNADGSETLETMTLELLIELHSSLKSSAIHQLDLT